MSNSESNTSVNTGVLYVGKGVIVGDNNGNVEYYPSRIFRSTRLCKFQQIVSAALTNNVALDEISTIKVPDFKSKGCIIHIEKWNTIDDEATTVETTLEYFTGKLNSSEIETLRNLL